MQLPRPLTAGRGSIGECDLDCHLLLCLQSALSLPASPSFRLYDAARPRLLPHIAVWSGGTWPFWFWQCCLCARPSPAVDRHQQLLHNMSTLHFCQRSESKRANLLVDA